jgi:hypothetical protein
VSRKPPLTYKNGYSNVVWAHNLGYNGSPNGIKGVLHRPSAYRYANPRFKSIPSVPAVRNPWDSAPAPWNLNGALSLASNSPFLRAGVDPTVVRGLDRVLKAQLAGYVREFLGAPRKGKHR